MEDEKESIRTPASAFITFNKVEASSLAKELLTEKTPQGIYPELFGAKIRCTRADNPSDIRWENKQTRFGRLLVRSATFAVVMGVLLYLAQFLDVFPLILKGQAATDVLPTVEQCDSMNKQYFKYPSHYKTEAEYDYQKL